MQKAVKQEPIMNSTRTQLPEQHSAMQSRDDSVLSRLAQANRLQQAELAHSSASPAAAPLETAAQEASPRQDFQVMASGVLPVGSPPCPLPEAVLRLFPQHFSSVTSARRACRRGEIWLEGAKSKTKSGKLVHAGQMVQWLQRVQGGRHMQHIAAPPGLHVVYEDADLACIVKPQGMPVAARGGQLDLQSALLSVLSPAQGTGALWRPRYVHRLDQPTGGLVMIAKSRPALAALCAAFSQREVKKTYLAIACGRLMGRGSVRYPLDGKPCLTEYEVLGHTRSAQHNWVTTVKLSPHTGRRHQLRRHLALIGHPLVNDSQYTYGFASQLLRSGGSATLRRSGGTLEGGSSMPACPEAGSGSEACVPDEGVPDEDASSSNSSSSESQDASVEDTNSADVALGRFGREPAAYPGPERDPDELSAATAVQRWEHDNSQGKRGRAGRVARRAEGKAVKPEGLQLQRPAHPGLGDVDASLLCLWAIGLSLTHPHTGDLISFDIEEPRLFDAVREREFQAWRAL